MIIKGMAISGTALAFALNRLIHKMQKQYSTPGNPMKQILAMLALGAAIAAPSHAGAIYTTSAAFLPNVAAGSYTNTFTGASDSPQTSYASNGFAYTISAASGLYSNGDFIGTNLPDQALLITFTGAAVTAIGANFYATNLSDAFQAIAITALLSDGTSSIFTPTSVANSYRGFTTDVAITSLRITAAGTSLYAGLDNLTVGRANAVNAVPEPASLALVGIGFLGLAAARRRRALPSAA